MNYRISFPANFEHVPALRDLAFHTAQLEGFPKQQAEHVKTITDEICNNAIEHGSQPTSEVELEIYSDAETIKITCQDHGHGNKLTAEEIKKRVSGEIPSETGRGRGMKMIVNAFADELEIKDRDGGGITVIAEVKKQGSEEARK